MQKTTLLARDRLADIIKKLPLMLLLNTGISLFLYLLLQQSFLEYFIYAQCIGLSIFLTTEGFLWQRNQCKKTLGVSIIAIPLGTLIGIFIASRINGDSLTELVTEHPKLLISSLAAALVFGSAISYYFFTRKEIAESQEALENETRLRSEQQRQSVETQLKLLQAQIEPHFLFNTLSNVLSLIDHDTTTAKRMLGDLTHYLRASLLRTRQEQSTLGEEIILLEAYLDIQVIRMGERLQYEINIPKSLRQHPLPPLLIQPLVENAIKHGIETETKGGKVLLQAHRDKDNLVIEVIDNGRGMDTVVGEGVGLNNIRSRLKNLFGNQGNLQLSEYPSGGVSAQITLPYTHQQANLSQATAK